MRKRQNTLKPSLGPFVNVSVIADTKYYPTHKNVVFMIREERRDYQSPAARAAWTRRCAALMHVLWWQASDAASHSGPIQPAIWWWWILWWRWQLAKPGATQEQGSHPPGACFSGRPL